eukprot:TRINITY_DN1578_c0_g2_i1.p1 TRINITY_DN1578_c0_g2~~TRINITY_DN1578_c0_g2_i1.p1  ORF type:complete len:652 (-),score=114.43 TRINITY_DN1578_c0_g2_i1:237-2192(-)
MTSSPRRLVFVERPAFSRSGISDDEELKCLSDRSLDLEEELLVDEEDYTRPYARCIAFVARKRQMQKQKRSVQTPEAQDPLPAPLPVTCNEQCAPSSPTKQSPAETDQTRLSFAERNEKCSWADVHDSEEEHPSEQMEGYVTDLSGDEGPAAKWQAKTLLHSKGSKDACLTDVETPLFVWDPIGISKDDAKLPSHHLLTKLSEDKSRVDKIGTKNPFGKWSWSTTASSAADEFEELLEENPPTVWPSMQRPSARQQQLATDAGAREYAPVSKENSPSLGVGPRMPRPSSCQQPLVTNAGSCQHSPVAMETSSCMGFRPGMQRPSAGQQPLTGQQTPVMQRPSAGQQPMTGQTPVSAQTSRGPGFGPGIQLASSGQQPLMANAGSCQHTPVAAETSPCMGFGIVPVMTAFHIVAVPYPAAQSAIMWQDFQAPQQAQQNEGQDWSDEAEEQHSWSSLSATGLAGSLAQGGAGRGPCFGNLHRFHQSMASMGVLSSDLRTFTKTQNKNRLSIVCEDRVHGHGVTRYAVQFRHGELSNADGVGFILAGDVPCTKNIQKIVSLFVNRTGRICVRMKQEVDRISARVKAIELGDWLEVVTDLEQRKLTFIVWPQDNSAPSSVTVGLGKLMSKANQRWPCGYLAVVVKNIGASVAFAS